MDNNNRHAKVMLGEDPHRHQPTQRTTVNKGILKVRGIDFPREEHVDWLSSNKMIIPESMHTDSIQTEQLPL